MVALAAELLDASPLCAIATVSPSSRAHVNTAYFAWSRDFHAVWMSEPSARHSLNLGPNNTVAIAVFDSHQTWDEPDRGIQLFGSAVEAKGRASKVLRQSTRDGSGPSRVPPECLPLLRVPRAPPQIVRRARFGHRGLCQCEGGGRWTVDMGAYGGLSAGKGQVTASSRRRTPVAGLGAEPTGSRQRQPQQARPPRRRGRCVQPQLPTSAGGPWPMAKRSVVAARCQPRSRLPTRPRTRVDPPVWQGGSPVVRFSIGHQTIISGKICARYHSCSACQGDYPLQAEVGFTWVTVCLRVASTPSAVGAVREAAAKPREDQQQGTAMART